MLIAQRINSLRLVHHCEAGLGPELRTPKYVTADCTLRLVTRAKDCPCFIPCTVTNCDRPDEERKGSIANDTDNMIGVPSCPGETSEKDRVSKATSAPFKPTDEIRDQFFFKAAKR